MSLISPLTDRILVERVREEWPTKISGPELEEWLIHREIALCLHEVWHNENNPVILNGFWTPNERYFEGHFDVLPGHWAGESAMLAGAMLGQLFDKVLRGSIPLLDRFMFTPASPVIFGMTLFHEVSLTHREGKKISFSSITKNNAGKVVTIGTFSGTAVPKELFLKMLSRMSR